MRELVENVAFVSIEDRIIVSYFFSRTPLWVVSLCRRPGDGGRRGLLRAPGVSNGRSIGQGDLPTLTTSRRA